MLTRQTLIMGALGAGNYSCFTEGQAGLQITRISLFLPHPYSPPLSLSPRQGATGMLQTQGLQQIYLICQNAKRALLSKTLNHTVSPITLHTT